MLPFSCSMITKERYLPIHELYVLVDPNSYTISQLFITDWLIEESAFTPPLHSFRIPVNIKTESSSTLNKDQ